MSYGTVIPGLEIDGRPAPYGVVNERAVRAGAGMMFAIGFFAFLGVYFVRDMQTAFWIVLVFWVDFMLKVFVGPSASYFGAIGKWLTSNQKPEYVGAIQKRFAWSIGVVFSTIVLGFLGYQLYLAPSCAHTGVMPGSSCFLPMLLCGICLVFMWLESAVGFCVGCSIYKWMVKKGIMKQEQYAPVCPGGVCDTNQQPTTHNPRPTTNNSRPTTYDQR